MYDIFYFIIFLLKGKCVNWSPTVKLLTFSAVFYRNSCTDSVQSAGGRRITRGHFQDDFGKHPLCLLDDGSHLSNCHLISSKTPQSEDTACEHQPKQHVLNSSQVFHFTSACLRFTLNSTFSSISLSSPCLSSQSFQSALKMRLITDRKLKKIHLI